MGWSVVVEAKGCARDAGSALVLGVIGPTFWQGGLLADQLDQTHQEWVGLAVALAGATTGLMLALCFIGASAIVLPGNGKFSGGMQSMSPWTTEAGVDGWIAVMGLVGSYVAPVVSVSVAAWLHSTFAYLVKERDPAARLSVAIQLINVAALVAWCLGVLAYFTGVFR